MNRRVWIKQILLASGGIVLIPACFQDEGAVSVLLKRINITGREESLFADFVEAILPETDTPGAKSLNIHQFVLKMFDDCYNEEEQEKLISGLRELNNFSEDTFSDKFTDLPQNKKLEILNKISAGLSVDGTLKFFLEETKSWTIKGFTSSEYFLTKITSYELVPARFHGCVPLKKPV